MANIHQCNASSSTFFNRLCFTPSVITSIFSLLKTERTIRRKRKTPTTIHCMDPVSTLRHTFVFIAQVHEAEQQMVFCRIRWRNNIAILMPKLKQPSTANVFSISARYCGCAVTAIASRMKSVHKHSNGEEIRSWFSTYFLWYGYTFG